MKRKDPLMKKKNRRTKKYPLHVPVHMPAKPSLPIPFPNPNGFGPAQGLGE